MSDLLKILTEGTDSEQEHVDAYQELIDTGTAWKLEGSVGREAMRLIEDGFCTVGEESREDYYGNRVPAISELEPGSKGTPEYVEAKTKERENDND